MTTRRMAQRPGPSRGLAVHTSHSSPPARPGIFDRAPQPRPGAPKFDAVAAGVFSPLVSEGLAAGGHVIKGGGKKGRKRGRGDTERAGDSPVVPASKMQHPQSWLGVRPQPPRLYAQAVHEDLVHGSPCSQRSEAPRGKSAPQHLDRRTEAQLLPGGRWGWGCTTAVACGPAFGVWQSAAGSARCPSLAGLIRLHWVPGAVTGQGSRRWHPSPLSSGAAFSHPNAPHPRSSLDTTPGPLV